MASVHIHVGLAWSEFVGQLKKYVSHGDHFLPTLFPSYILFISVLGQKVSIPGRMAIAEQFIHSFSHSFIQQIFFRG